MRHRRVSVAGRFQGFHRAGAGIDAAKLNNVLARGRPVFLESSGGDKNTAFKRPDGVVVLLHGGIKTASRIGEMPRHHAKSIVELLAKAADGLGILLDALLSPAIRNGPQ